MAVLHQRVTVGTTATLIAEASSNRDGLDVMIQSAKGASVEVYVGGEGVTTTDYGHLIDPDENFDLHLYPGEKLYGVTSAGTHILNILKTSA